MIATYGVLHRERLSCGGRLPANGSATALVIGADVHSTVEPGRWDPDPATGHAILERCIRLDPRLADAQVINHLIGLRPTRPHVQVDLQHHPSGATIAHNYGHGGAGVSLSWGCATEITDLLCIATPPR